MLGNIDGDKNEHKDRERYVKEGNADKENEPQGGNDEHDRNRVYRYKMVQTFALVLCWTVMGFYVSIWATTLPDMRARFGTTTKDISRADGVKRIGYMVGGLFPGIVNDRLEGKALMFLSTSLVVAGVSVCAMPWSGNLQIFGFLKFWEGASQGTIDAVGNSYVLSLWGKKAAPAMHAIHFGYPVGSIFSPIMTAHFIAQDGGMTSTNGSSNINSNYSSTDDSISGASRVEIPYVIAGVITFSISIAFFILTFAKPPRGFTLEIKAKDSIWEVINPASCGRGKAWYGFIMVMMMVVMFSLQYSAFTPIINFGFTYATESDLNFTKQQGTLLDLSIHISGTVGRFIGIILSYLISINILLVIEVILVTISCNVLAFSGTTDGVIFWVFCSTSTCLFYIIWPGLFSFMNKYIILSSFVVAITQLTGLGGFFLEWFLGYLYDHVFKGSIFIVSAISTIMLLTVFIILQGVASILGPRHDEEEELLTGNSESKREYVEMTSIMVGN